MGDTPDALGADAPGIVAHMNDDHAGTLLLYARALAGIADATAAHMPGVDRLGFDRAVTTESGARAARVAFSRPVSRAEDVRRELIVLARRARGDAAP